MKLIQQIKTPKFFKLKEKILSQSMEWYFEPYSANNKHPFFAHVVKHRDVREFNSYLADETIEVFTEICLENNIEPKEIYRVSYNSTFYQDDELTDFHIDYEEPHQVFLLYFTTNDRGPTAISDVKYSNVTSINNDEVGMIKKVYPNEDTALIFDGHYYHAGGHPKSGERRVVLTVNFK
jgi:hypothetical protein